MSSRESGRKRCRDASLQLGCTRGRPAALPAAAALAWFRGSGGGSRASAAWNCPAGPALSDFDRPRIRQQRLPPYLPEASGCTHCTLCSTIVLYCNSGTTQFSSRTIIWLSSAGVSFCHLLAVWPKAFGKHSSASVHNQRGSAFLRGGEAPRATVAWPCMCGVNFTLFVSRNLPQLFGTLRLISLPCELLYAQNRQGKTPADLLPLVLPPHLQELSELKKAAVVGEMQHRSELQEEVSGVSCNLRAWRGVVFEYAAKASQTTHGSRCLRSLSYPGV